jgi:hypothetical protein
MEYTGNGEFHATQVVASVGGLLELGLPADMHLYAILPIGYPIGRFGPVRRVSLTEVVYENRWGQPYRDQ